MCLSAPKLPKAPPIPRVPSRMEEAVNAEDIIRKRMAGAKGRTANIVSGAMGDPNYGSSSSSASSRVRAVNVMGV